ncbi:MAG: hypothetical protein KDA87_15425, partial [Planctomycetales bacterium]|nr:hypothetical protein [Planctomycetales bacterium]
GTPNSLINSFLLKGSQTVTAPQKPVVDELAEKYGYFWHRSWKQTQDAYKTLDCANESIIKFQTDQLKLWKNYIQQYFGHDTVEQWMDMIGIWFNLSNKHISHLKAKAQELEAKGKSSKLPKVAIKYLTKLKRFDIDIKNNMPPNLGTILYTTKVYG